MLIRLLIIMTMTLSTNAASPQTNALAVKLDTLFQDYNQPGSPGASVIYPR